MQDVPITRETQGSYQPLNAQYSNLPAQLQERIASSLSETSNQLAEQSNKSYLLGTTITMKKELARIEQENIGNPAAMESSFQKFKEGFFDKVDGDDNRLLLQEQFAAETMPYVRRAQAAMRERLDSDTATQGLTLVESARDHILANSSGIFSKDPGAVYDATRNLAVQSGTIEEVSKLTKSDGTPMWTPEQRAKMLELPNASMSDAAALVWAQRPDAEKLSIVEGAMKGEKGMPNDLGADTVKPYSRERIAEVQKTVDKPSQYDALFKKYAAQYGVDWKELKLRAVVESGLDPNAVGPETQYGQSVGIMQFTEETAKSMGIKDRKNPEQSIAAGAELLAQHTKSAGGDPGTVDKLYYGGADRKKWGKNTNQYAENLRAVRGAGMGETGTEFDYLSPMQKATAFNGARDAININAMRFATPQERKAIVSASGSDTVLRANTAITTALSEDPAAYVAQSPEIVAAFEKARTDASPEAYGQFITTSMAMQARMGVPSYAQRIMPKAQAQAEVGAVLDGFASNQNIHEYMIGMQGRYGTFWPRAFQELQAAKLPPAAMVLGTMTYETQKPYGRMLSSAISEGGDNIFKALGPDAKKEISKAVDGELDDFRISAQRARGGTDLINAVSDATELLTAKLIQSQGLSVSAAATMAADAIANEYQDYRGTYRVPKPYTGSDIADAADITLDELSGPLLSPGQGKEDAEAYLSSTRARGYWVNAPEGDGLMLKDDAGNYVRREDGTYIRYGFDKLQEISAGRGAEMDQQRVLEEMNKIPGGF